MGEIWTGPEKSRVPDNPGIVSWLKLFSFYIPQNISLTKYCQQTNVMVNLFNLIMIEETINYFI